MATEQQLTMLKVDLGLLRPTDEQKTYLNGLLDTAASAIKREGITLDDTIVEDSVLVGMYAAWLYRKRINPGPMPDMLRYQLRNKLVSQKMKVTE